MCVRMRRMVVVAMIVIVTVIMVMVVIMGAIMMMVMAVMGIIGVRSDALDVVMVAGLGQADLRDNKADDARKQFEAALTASRRKNGNDPQVATAVGRRSGRSM